nr:NAD(P)H-dependent oxidoreductase [Methanobacterium formicicum]
MKISVILAHPYPESFNHAIYQTVLETLKKNGHQIQAHNLYEEGFNPLLEGSELATGETSDPLVLQHRQEIKKGSRNRYYTSQLVGSAPGDTEGMD